ncbi:MAG TPA: nucleotide disphospho-sugar-binding domain-containing protein [Propionicimonas sp.]
MKILFASIPADGHFVPLTGLAVHLSDGGHDVRWYAGPTYAPKAEHLGLPVFGYHRATEVTGENFNTLYPERAKLRGPKLIAFDAEHLFVTNVQHYYDDIVALREEFPFDVMIVDGAFYAAQLVAAELGVPVYARGLPAVLPDAASPPPFFGLKPARTPLDRLVHAVVRRMVASASKPAIDAYNTILTDHGIAPIGPHGFPHEPIIAAATRIWMDSTPGMEFPGYRPPASARYVGQLEPARHATVEVELPDAVTDPGRRVVVVSQGTVDNTDPSKLIIPTLQALHDQGHTIVVTTGGSHTDELRARYGSPTVIIEDYIPYATLFPHADVFVSNGGYGSGIAALSRGIPVVAAGTREGKNDNNVRLATNHLAVDLRSETPRKAKIRAAVRRALTDPSIRAAVTNIQAELATYDALRIIEADLMADATARATTTRKTEGMAPNIGHDSEAEEHGPAEQAKHHQDPRPLTAQTRARRDV